MSDRLRRGFAVAAVLVLVTGFAACGDDDDDDDGAAGDAGLAATCAAQVRLTAGFEVLFPTFDEVFGQGEGEGEEGPSPEGVAKIRQVYDENIAPALEGFDENAPDAIRADVDKGIAIFEKFRAQPDPETLNDPEFDAIGGRIDRYLYDNCQGAKAEVGAIEYAFRDLPAQATAGPLRIRLENTGKESHELVFFSRKPGVTESFDQIVALDPRQAFEKVDARFGAAGDPGTTEYGLVDLKAGDYLAACFLPKGITSLEEGPPGPPPEEGQEERPPEEPPHATLGMRQAVKVT